LYSVADVKKIFGNQERINEKKKICYARVSSDHELIKNIKSDFNWKCKGFTSILKQLYQGNIKEVVVTHKDRLCRFFVKHDIKVMVLGSDINVDDTESGELAEDLLSIITIFTARHNRFRSAENRK